MASPAPPEAAARRLLDLILAFGLSRLAILAVGFYGMAMFVDQHSLTVGGALALSPEATWHKWDVIWYEQIALHGYGYMLEDLKGQAAAGFFPLYPVLVGLIIKALPFLSFFWLGSVMSNVFTFTALLLIVRELSPNVVVARRVAIILVTAAGSFYLSIPYTESLFMVLVVLVMIATRRREYLLAAILAGLAFATRIHGLALIAVPAVACRYDTTLTVRARYLRLAMMALLFAIPMSIHMAYLAEVQGSAEAFIARQAMWDNAVPYPFKAVAGLIRYPKRVQGWLHGAYWGVYVALVFRYWRKMPLGEAIFCLGALVISTQQEVFHGIYRYVVPLVPIALAQAQDDDTVRRGLVGMNVALAVLMILAFVTWNRLAV